MSSIRPSSDGRWQRYLTNEITRFFGEVSLGNCTQWKVGAMKTQNGIFVGVEHRGAAEFCQWAHWANVKVNLGIDNESDSRNLADFINAQLGLEGELQGAYIEYFCQDHAHEDIL